MNVESKKYCSKILIYGEYMVILDSQALAIPIRNFHGYLKIKAEESSHNIGDFLSFISEELNLNLNLPPNTKLENVVFESTIPIGYGVGSSGALCAAVYDNLVSEKKLGIKELQKELATLEHFFHGTSSGIDPLVSFLNQPIKSSATGLAVCSLGDKKESLLNYFYLIDTGVSRQTGPLVKIFKEKMNDVVFSDICEIQLTKKNEIAIDALLKNDRNDLEKATRDISKIQFRYFKEMIPGNYLGLWEETLKDSEITFKLCGAGGGGFILAYCENKEYMAKWLIERKLSASKVLY